MKKEIFTGIKLLVFMTLLLGIIYPLFTLWLAQTIFPSKASGSFLASNEKYSGSILIGQGFVSDKYFNSRPSSVNYNPMPSAASNLSQTSKALKLLYEERKESFISRNSLTSAEEIPREMLFASGSGVDPHITPRAAYLQIERISKVRGFSISQKEKLKKIINELIEKPQLGFLGNSAINVLLLNIELDKL